MALIAGDWTGHPVASDPASQAAAQANITNPPPGPSLGQTQTVPVSVEDYATGQYAPFSPGTDWTRTGGNSTSSVFVNNKTGEVVYVGNDGRLQDHFTSMAQANAGEGSITDVIPGGAGYKPDADTIGATDQARQTLVDFANQLQTTRDQYGAGTQAGTAPTISASMIGPNGVPVAAPPPPPPQLQPNPNNDPAIMASNQAAQGAYNRALAEWKAAPPQTQGPSIYGGPASSMEAAQSMGAPQIDTSALSARALAIKPQAIAAPGAITAPDISGAPGAKAQQIRQPGAITTEQVGAQQIGPVGLGADATANKQSQDAAQAMLKGAAAGTAPSAAEALLRKGIDENEGAALGMAATLQGSRPGLALRTGLQASRAAVAKSAADMAALRANEQATGRQQYAEATTSARGQDIQAASTNLQAQVDTLKANQQAALAAGNANAANALQAQIQTLQSQLDASKANQQAALQATLATQSTQADLTKANAANQLQAQIVSMQQQIEVAKQNAANALAAGQSNQAAALQAQIATMNSQLDALKANQAAALSTATVNAGLTQQANQTNATLAQNQSQFGATQQLAAAKANQEAALTVDQKNQQSELMQQQLNNQQYLGLTQEQLQANIAPYQAMIQQQQIAQQTAAANQAFYGQLYASGATALAASDVTLKTDISDGAAAALDFLDALPDPVTYRYKDGRAHYPGKQLGVIAQKLPPAVVTTGPDGKKWISANVIGQVLAGLGVVHKRLGKIEESREIARLTRRGAGDTVTGSDVADFARRLAS